MWDRAKSQLFGECKKDNESNTIGFNLSSWVRISFSFSFRWITKIFTAQRSRAVVVWARACLGCNTPNERVQKNKRVLDKNDIVCVGKRVREKILSFLSDVEDFSAFFKKSYLISNLFKKSKNGYTLSLWCWQPKLIFLERKLFSSSRYRRAKNMVSEISINHEAQKIYHNLVFLIQ